MQVALPIELEDVRPVLVGDEEGPVAAHADALRIEAQRRAIVARSKADAFPTKLPVALVLQEPRVEQRRPDVGKRRARGRPSMCRKWNRSR